VPSVPRPTAPVPISAAWSVGTGNFSCTFDQPLQTASLVEANWIVVANARFRILTNALAVGSNVGSPTFAGGITGPPSRVSYAAAPPDVVGLVGGLPAAPFSNFPVTVVP
jgi:hypothetical protein